ncbi:MAG: helix-turn-helix domain-containing protein [Candidatus Bathyarchaeia archaeon]
MSIENIVELLQSFGLTRVQAQIFVHLTKKGASSISALSSTLKTNRMNVYRNLKKMQNMGIVDVIPGKPMKFSAVPVALALDILLSATKNKVLEMENKRTKILEEFSKLSSQQQGYTVESKFRVHCGRRNVYSVMIQMLEKSEREACLLTTPSDLMRMAIFGFSDVLRKISAKGVRVKILTNITDRRLFPLLKDYIKYTTLRHSDISITTRFLVTDEKAAFTSLSTDDSMGLESESDSGFWTDSPHYIRSLRAFFEVAWRGAQDASLVLWHLRTGKPMEKITAFNDVEEFYKNLVDMVNRAEREVLICVTRLKEPFMRKSLIEALRRSYARGVKIRIMISIDEETDNLESLLEIAEMRHMYAKHFRIDFATTEFGESLLSLPISFVDENKFQALYLWSNSRILSAVLNELFTDLWLRSPNFSIRLAEMRFKKALREFPEVLRAIIVERGWILEMPATIRGKSGLNQTFDMALGVRGSAEGLVVGDFLPEGGDIKMALISLHIKAIDVGASQKLLIMPSSEWLSLEEKKIAMAYNIELIEGLKAEEISQKIIEKIINRVQGSA